MSTLPLDWIATALLVVVALLLVGNVVMRARRGDLQQRYYKLQSATFLCLAAAMITAVPGTALNLSSQVGLVLSAIGMVEDVAALVLAIMTMASREPRGRKAVDLSQPRSAPSGE
ncbi:MAG TPA: hypothetical protein VGX23_32800 [Actinocrinis sp.]|nr:hypothetical protein [Actinocrinis sp.]